MVDKLILGTVQMGIDYGINNVSGKVPFDESIEILKQARSAGIQMVDTAEAYGDAHQVIGAYHGGVKKEDHKFKVITKIPHNFSGSIEARLKAYLLELCVSSIWGLMFHSFDTYIKSPELIAHLTILKEQEYVRHIGVSVYTNEQFSKAILDEKIDIIQLPFNLLDNYSVRGALIREAKQKGKILHTRSAFLQGLFFMDKENDNRIVNELNQELNMLDHIASDAGESIGSLALGYCLAQPEIDSVLIGVDSLSQLQANILFSNKLLAADVMDAVDKVKVNNLDLLNPSLWK